MKVINNAFAAIICSATILSPIATFARDGNITARLLGHSIALGADEYKVSQDYRVYYNWLSPNYYHKLTYDLRSRKSYIITATCDENCSDIDLEIYDVNDNLIYADKNANKDPKIKMNKGGRYKLRVIMQGCRASSCEYGVAVFDKQIVN
ncbi:MAG: hypothetical protein QNJ47_14635 [Nostocaceae cyanobacterium]|nr:hypothetical protein [Nostocaceae cyanobacterium]